MKKKERLIISTIITTGLLAVSVGAAFLLKKKINNVAYAGDAVNNATLTFNYSHKTVTTQYGNTITSNGNGSSPYLHSFSGNGYWQTTKPIQTIHSVTVSYSTTELGVLHNVYVGYSSTSNVSSSQTSKSGTIIKSQQTSGTYTMSNSNANAHYVFVQMVSYDSSIPFYLTTITITYSCS